MISDASVRAAALIVSGGQSGDPAGRELAIAALAAMDRHVMDDIVEHLDAEHVPSGKAGPRVSDYGACRRSVWYRESPPDGFVADPKQYDRQAAIGTLVHEAAAKARAASAPWRWYETEIQAPGLDRPGRLDEYDPVLGEVSDTKTAGVRRWDQVGDDGPDESAWGQVSIYAYALDERGHAVRTVRIMMVNRDSGAEEHFRRDYDPADGRKALDDLIELATMLELGVIPPRDGTGPATDWRCRSCFARSHCWNIPAATEAERSPESFTVLGAEPDDTAIEWAARRYLEAKAEADVAKAAADVAKELLQGVEPGTYGDVVVKANRRSMPEYKDSFTRAVQLYALSEVHRPPVAEVAEPVKRVDRWTSVSRVRAAKRKKAS
jgi:CRISPR/Cas system-associated exonuclease Cas4 (RecB family)